MQLTTSLFTKIKFEKRCIYYAHLHETTSTNTVLKDFIKNNRNTEKILVLSADIQTQGRGTRGRTWQMAKESLLFSVGITIDQNLSHFEGLSLVIGKHVVSFLRKEGIPASIKWPNDIYVGYEKIAGILVEATQTADKKLAFIIGVGMNVSGAPKSVGTDTCSLSDFKKQAWSPELKKQWIEALAHTVVDAFDERIHQGLKPTMQMWEKIASFQGELIDLYLEDEIIDSGVLRCVDERGRLLVSTSKGEKVYSSVTIRLRKQKK